MVTAGNSSQICDGASAVLVTSGARLLGSAWGRAARFVSFGLVGVDPRLMLHGNPQAVRAGARRGGARLDDVAVVEVNEAFACVALQIMRDAGLEERWDDVNPNGGGISLGHPLGATGARMTRDAAERARAARRPLRRGDDVHRLRHGDAAALMRTPATDTLRHERRHRHVTVRR